jgi:hypothetical protein
MVVDPGLAKAQSQTLQPLTDRSYMRFFTLKVYMSCLLSLIRSARNEPRLYPQISINFQNRRQSGNYYGPCGSSSGLGGTLASSLAAE